MKSDLSFLTFSNVVSISAVLISLYGVWQTKRNIRKKIFLDKVEEIMSLINTVSHEYEGLYWLYITLKPHFSKDLDAQQRQDALKQFEEAKRKYNEKRDNEALLLKISKLSSYANGYISNEDLRTRIIGYCDVYRKIMMSTVYRQMMFEQAFYKEGFPNTTVMFQIVGDIEKRLIKSMGFNTKLSKISDAREYIKNEVKKLESS